MHHFLVKKLLSYYTAWDLLWVCVFIYIYIYIRTYEVSISTEITEKLVAFKLRSKVLWSIVVPPHSIIMRTTNISNFNFYFWWIKIGDHIINTASVINSKYKLDYLTPHILKTRFEVNSEPYSIKTTLLST